MDDFEEFLRDEGMGPSEEDLADLAAYEAELEFGENPSRGTTVCASNDAAAPSDSTNFDENAVQDLPTGFVRMPDLNVFKTRFKLITPPYCRNVAPLPMHKTTNISTMASTNSSVQALRPGKSNRGNLAKIAQKQATDATAKDKQEALNRMLAEAVLKNIDRTKGRKGRSDATIGHSSLSVLQTYSPDDGTVGVGLLERHPNDGHVQTFDITIPDAGIFYIPVIDSGNSALSSPAPTFPRGRSSLLERPIESIMAEVSALHLAELRQVTEGSHDMLSRAAAARKELEEAMAGANTAAPARMEEDAEGNSEDEAGQEDMEEDTVGVLRAHDGAARGHALWVDKYAPRLFSDLLSEERINRNVLRWIKVWDERVFGKRASENEHALAAEVKAQAALIAQQAAVKQAFAARDRPGPPANSQKPAYGQGQYGQNGQQGQGLKDSIFSRFGYGWNPYARVLLLCGPPGKGKTTLAHVVAKHAGYKVSEINASDERTGETIRQKISAAQSMGSVATVLGPDGLPRADTRPVLTVLDECDGMDQAAITELCKMIKATPSLAPRFNAGQVGSGAGVGAGAGGEEGDKGDGSDEDEQAGKDAGAGNAGKRKRHVPAKKGRKSTSGDGESSGKDSIQPLTRPLICICNDQFAPSLRELRPLIGQGMVQVVTMEEVSPQRLYARLKQICQREGLVVTQDALQSLITATDADVRACLNTLQFIRAQGAAAGSSSSGHNKLSTGRLKRVTTEMILRASVGCKDQTKAVMDVWAAVYGRAVGAKGAASLTGAQKIKSAVGAGGLYADLLTQLSAYTSEASLLLSGLQENAPSSMASDPMLVHLCRALDWCCYGDNLISKGMTGGAMSLQKYAAWAGMGVHLHLSTEQGMKPRWPHGDTTLRNGREGKRAILTSFVEAKGSAPAPTLVLQGLSGSPAASGGTGGLSIAVLASDAISPLLSILNPNLRAVNFSLYNSKERSDAATLIQTLVSLGLNYTRINSGAHRKGGQDEDDAGEYSLQPDLSRLIEFEGYQAWEIRVTGLAQDGGAESKMLRGAELHPIVMQMIGQEVRQTRATAAFKARLAQEEAEAAVKAGGAGAGAAGSEKKAPSPVGLPEHVKRQMAAKGHGLVALMQSTVETSAAAGMETDASAVSEAAAAVDAVPKLSAQMSFLAGAAQRSRQQQLHRKRIAITIAEEEKQAKTALGTSIPTPVSLGHASSLEGVGVGGGAGAGDSSSAPQPTTNGRAKLQACAVIFKYQEGFTNAVKRPVTGAMFWGSATAIQAS